MRFKGSLAAMIVLAASTGMAAETVDVSKVKLYGRLDFLASYSSSNYRSGTGLNETSFTDVTADYLTLGAEAEISPKMKANIVVTWDDSLAAVEMDEAYLTYEHDPFTFTVGRIYMPYVQYLSKFATYPLTRDLAEARETVLMLTYSPCDQFNASAFTFNGETTEAGSKHDYNEYGVSVAANPFPWLQAGASYTSNLGESDTSVLTALTYTEKVPGATAYAALDLAPVEVFAEFVTALRDFDKGDIGHTEDQRPMAFHIEASYAFCEKWKALIGADVTDEWFGAPLTRYEAGAEWQAWENARLVFEYANALYTKDEHPTLHRTQTLNVLLSASF